jgi:hypothetical protein
MQCCVKNPDIMRKKWRRFIELLYQINIDKKIKAECLQQLVSVPAAIHHCNLISSMLLSFIDKAESEIFCNSIKILQALIVDQPYSITINDLSRVVEKLRSCHIIYNQVWYSPGWPAI